jgi:uncharacterized protein YyaL (SSP411 family)
MESGKFNHLKGEESPYLKQHVTNPVDWYPWSEEAFKVAKRDNKLIFLSIGYSTCHWCHVMERESFSKEKVGKAMNENFICIKVDREERPDLDAYFIDFSNKVSGNAGWPLNIILLPDLRPVFPFTYIPPESRYGSMGLLELLKNIDELWKNNPEEMIRRSEEIKNTINIKLSNKFITLNENLPELSIEQLSKTYDDQYAGFGRTMKFPSPHIISFLATYSNFAGNANSLEMAERTVAAIRMGGIYDHIGFGIHRYATDSGWKIPHFEKMLYDQAGFLKAVSKLYKTTGKKQYIDLAKEILVFLKEKMRSNEGGYYTAYDADSEDEEGKYYTWKSEELRHILKEGSEEFFELFNVREDGNYIEEPRGFSNGKNILYLENQREYAKKFLNSGEFWLNGGIKEMLEALKTVRELRVSPSLDNKICGDLNGFLLSALSDAYDSSGENEFLLAADELYKFLSQKYVKNGQCMHLIYNENKSINGYMSDYAFIAYGFFSYGFATANSKAIELGEEIFDRLNIILAKEMDVVKNKNLSSFIGTLSAQEDSSMPSQFSVYERVNFYNKLVGNFNDPVNIMTKETEENIEKYPSYFTFRMETVLEEKNSFILKGNFSELSVLKKTRSEFKNIPRIEIFYFNDQKIAKNQFSLCNSSACVIENKEIGKILDYIKGQKNNN